jgi:pimeloyl-ACP methyl ester carboxylesterase
VGVSGRARTRFNERVADLVKIDPATNFPVAWVRDLKTPGLIVHDRGDEDAPFAEGEELHRAWRGSRFFATTGLGHRRVLKSKEVIAEIVAFLSAT